MKKKNNIGFIPDLTQVYGRPPRKVEKPGGYRLIATVSGILEREPETTEEWENGFRQNLILD